MLKGEKIFLKAIKNINKKMKKNPQHLGRFFIRDCFHKQNENNIFSCCIECVDKQTGKKYFYAYVLDCSKANLKRVEKNLEELLNSYIVRTPEHLKENGRSVDFRKVKID